MMRRSPYIAAAAGLIAVAALVVSLGANAQEPGPTDLTDQEVLALTPIDTAEAVEAGWPATTDLIESRSIDWYNEVAVSQASEADLERAIDLLFDTIADPPIDRQPDRIFYVHEMINRMEAACRSLSPDNPLRREYCSETSLPSLDVEAVPWATS
jgi:hypothetical protein